MLFDLGEANLVPPSRLRILYADVEPGQLENRSSQRLSSSEYERQAPGFRKCLRSRTRSVGLPIFYRQFARLDQLRRVNPIHSRLSQLLRNSNLRVIMVGINFSLSRFDHKRRHEMYLFCSRYFSILPRARFMS